MADKSKAPAPILKIDERYLRDGDLERHIDANEEDIAAFNDQLKARALSQPEVRAASVIQQYEGAGMELNALVTELHEQSAAVSAGKMDRPEAMLIAQAHTLDALFANLARRAAANATAGKFGIAESYLRLGLRAQAQAVRTIEALAEIKNPRQLAFVQQANICNGPQQINNGIPTIKKLENHPSKLLEGQNGERLDTRTKSQTSGDDSAMEAVGKINRPQIGRRKTQGRKEWLQGRRAKTLA